MTHRARDATGAQIIRADRHRYTRAIDGQHRLRLRTTFPEEYA
jgi:hypothetical protein